MPDKKLHIKWTEPALEDLEQVAIFISQDNPVKATAFVLEILEKVESILPQYPGAGKPGRLLGTRELVIHENYLVPYRVIGTQIEILRVLHTAREWPKS